MKIMNLKDFVITNGKASGLDDDQIAGILQSAIRKLPLNVPEEKWAEQIMEWINLRAERNNNFKQTKKEKEVNERE